MIQRIVTGMIAAAIFLPLVVYGGIPFTILIYLIASIALIELLRMKHMLLLSFPGIFSIVTLWLLLLPNFEMRFHISKIEIIGLLVLLLLTYTVITKNGFTFEDAGFFIVTVLYLGFGFSYFMEIREIGLAYIFLVLFVIWATDSGAYFVGRAVGKWKLWPEISPKKTIEGAIGGILVALVVALLFNLFVPIDLTLMEIIIISFLLAIFGQIGDLVESAFKRHYKVKDSGKILPGHGGVLDRLDSLIFVLPILHMLLKLFL